MTTQCEDVRRLIARACLEDLPPQEQQFLLAHLAECPGCRMEQELYTTTVQQLRTAPDKDVPRHFFVYPEIRLSWLGGLFGGWSLRWKAATVVTAALLIFGIGLIAANLRWRVEDGVYSFSFGRRPMARPIEPALSFSSSSLKQELLQVVEARLRAERSEWVQLIRTQIQQSNANMSRQQRQVLQAALKELGARMDAQIVSTRTALEARNDQTVLGLYAAWETQRERDLSTFSSSLGQMAARREVKDRQTDAILGTLLQVAELKIQ